ncbi:MAG: LptF/LptG family permease [Planctomycetes bacterium]|nr:LptF/LptG family permease [Planctomycetota bacterium]MCB9886238.1 LptF/LptG family permease [Planctomycetota bacterium]
MWKLHRYYLRELAINSAITFLVLFAVVLVSLVARGIQRSQGGGALDAALITLFWALDSFPHLLTVAFLIATVLTFARAAQDRELIAIRAAGVPPRAPMAAALLFGIGLAISGSVAMHYVLPEIHFRKYRVIADVVRSAFMNLNLGSDRIKILDTGYVMTFRRREGADYLDCTIYCPPNRIVASMKSPILKVERVSIPLEEGSDSIAIVLHGIHDPIGGLMNQEMPLRIPMQDLAERGRRDERDDDLRSDQLLAEVLRGVHPQPVAAIYTLFRRCNFAIMPVLMAPIGFCIAEFAQARGRVLALVLALVPLGMFYLGEVLGARLLIATDSPWCAWMPVLLLSLVGGPLLWRQLRR